MVVFLVGAPRGWFECQREFLKSFGSEQESVSRPVFMGDLILVDSGYTRRDEGDGLDESAGVAGVSGLSQ